MYMGICAHVCVHACVHGQDMWSLGLKTPGKQGVSHGTQVWGRHPAWGTQVWKGHLHRAHQASRLKRVELLSQRGREVSPSVGCGGEVLEKSERVRSSTEQCTGIESLLAMRETRSS